MKAVIFLLGQLWGLHCHSFTHNSEEHPLQHQGHLSGRPSSDNIYTPRSTSQWPSDSKSHQNMDHREFYFILKNLWMAKIDENWKKEKEREKEWEIGIQRENLKFGVRKWVREKKQNGHKYKTERAQEERREESEEQGREDRWNANAQKKLFLETTWSHAGTAHLFLILAFMW